MASSATSDPVGESWSDDAETGVEQSGAQRSGGGVVTGMGGARGPGDPA